MNVATARADGRQDVQDFLNLSYKGKVLILRSFYRGDRLQYDSDGKLVSGGTPGTWTLDSNFEVRRVKVRHNKIEIDGDRIFLTYSSEARQFGGLRATVAQIDIEIDPDQMTLATVKRVFPRIFLTADDRTVSAAPSYWKPVLEGKDSKQPALDASGTLDGQPVYSFRGKDEEMSLTPVSPPTPVSTPDPPYTEEARRARAKGQLLLSIIVDTHGNVWDVIETGKPLGFGLDQLSIETVRSWKFTPAIRDGKPVAVRMIAEISFKLF